ncbi:hypothetical protein FACS1894137_00920 [Spirochaetia bacterium]|nr:hypothetical protein FACS1894137_00920 [Spirochaetia bacterium]
MASFARAHLLYNSEVSPAKLAEMGFGPKPKPAPEWHEAPILSMVHKIRQVNVRFKGKNAARWVSNSGGKGDWGEMIPVYFS